MIGITACSVLTGCQHAASPAEAPERPAVSKTQGAPNTIELPARTPFDDDADLRAFYLEWYTNGYTLGVTNAEYSSPGCRCEAKGDPRRYAAMADGFFDGLKAGTEAYEATVKERSAQPR